MARIKAWQQEVYGWSEPQFYGQELARVAYFADFAVWEAWAAAPEEGVEQRTETAQILSYQHDFRTRFLTEGVKKLKAQQRFYQSI